MNPLTCLHVSHFCAPRRRDARLTSLHIAVGKGKGLGIDSYYRRSVLHREAVRTVECVAVIIIVAAAITATIVILDITAATITTAAAVVAERISFTR